MPVHFLINVVRERRLARILESLHAASLAIIISRPWAYITFLCSTQLSIKFIMLIKVKMPTIVGILTFISMIDITSDSFMGESSKFPKSWTLEISILKLTVCPLNIHNFKIKRSIVVRQTENKSEKLIQSPYFSILIMTFLGKFLWKVILKILKSGMILKTFIHVAWKQEKSLFFSILVFMSSDQQLKFHA